MIVHSLACGEMNNVVYILEDPYTKQAAVVDPAWDVPGIIAILDQHQLELTSILLTHGHFDHTEGLVALLAYKQVPTYMSENELPKLIPTVSGMRLTQDNDVIQIGQTRVYVLHTPGHSPGGQCFYAAPHLIAGDTLFIDGCGRCDLGGSEVEKMYQSLERLKTLPADTCIYPGHDYGFSPTDTLKSQCERNGYLRCESETDFIRKRLGRRA